MTDESDEPAGENWGGISEGFDDIEAAADTETDTESSETADSRTGSGSPKTQSQSVKEERDGVYFYLPESQHEELNYQYKLASAEYEREFETSFEKNRHFYPLVVQFGLERIAAADATEINELLHEIA